MRAKMRNCKGCGSIQRAEVRCPLCGEDTGPPPEPKRHDEALRDIRRAEWASTNHPKREFGGDITGRAHARRAAWVAARHGQERLAKVEWACAGLAQDFYHEELALMAAGVGSGVVP